MKHIFADLIEQNRDVARWHEREGWAAAEMRGRELAEHVATIKATYLIVPDKKQMHFVHKLDGVSFAMVFAAAVPDPRLGNFRAIDSERTQVSAGNPHPPRAFEIVVEHRLEEIARAS